jgi:hypothetical protein
MAVSDADIARLRRMANELDNTIYSDDLLASYLEAWPVYDSEGRSFEEAEWVEGYDLHAAAGDIWEEKASAVAHKHDFSADGASFSSSQLHEMYSDQARYHRARQKAKTKLVVKRPTETSSSLLYQQFYANVDPPGEAEEEDFLDLWENFSADGGAF